MYKCTAEIITTNFASGKSKMWSYSNVGRGYSCLVRTPLLRAGSIQLKIDAIGVEQTEQGKRRLDQTRRPGRGKHFVGKIAIQ